MKALTSDNRRHLFERIEQKNQQARNVEASFPRGGSSPSNPSAMISMLQFEEVDDIAQFQIDYMLWMQEQRTESQKQELAHRLSNLETAGIQSGQVYGDYGRRFQYMLDTISLLAELGEVEKATELAHRVLALAEIAPKGTSDVKLLTLQWGLRSDALWTLANAFEQEDLFRKSLECMKSAFIVSEFDSKISAMARKHAAKLYHSLAESGISPTENLTSARDLLRPLAKSSVLDLENWSIYFKVLMNLHCYVEAYDAAQQMLKIAEIEGGSIREISVHEVVASEYLSKHLSPRDFLNEFGPFACPLYAECKKIYLSDAWHDLYNESMPGFVNQQSMGTGFLLGNVVVYENNDPLMGQNEISIHEGIHLAVRRGQRYQSEGEWLTAHRDVPTAALVTYMNQIEKAQQSGIELPDSLRFFVDVGRRSFANHPQKCHSYIEKMLLYFDKHGEETNATYQCAGIHAGMLVGMLGTLSSEELHSYTFHLIVTDHRTALKKSKRKVKLVL